MGRPSSTAMNEAAFDLFDRWLAHREQQAREAARAAPRDAASPAADAESHVEGEEVPRLAPRPRRERGLGDEF